jgi:hypothetical protein
VLNYCVNEATTRIDESFGGENKRLVGGRSDEPEMKLNIKNSFAGIIKTLLPFGCRQFA